MTGDSHWRRRLRPCLPVARRRLAAALFAGVVLLAVPPGVGGCSSDDSANVPDTEDTTTASPGASTDPDTAGAAAPADTSDAGSTSPDTVASEDTRHEPASTVDTAGLGSEVGPVGGTTGEIPQGRSGNAFIVSPQSESGLRVARAYVCKGIEESEPTEAGKSFIPDDGGDLRLCCFSEISGAADRDTILHIWYWGEREMARVPLEVRGPSWRTWSSKRIADAWRGEWHVDITDGDGTVLARLPFSVE